MDVQKFNNCLNIPSSHNFKWWPWFHHLPSNFIDYAHCLFYCNLQIYIQSVPARHSATQYSKKFLRPHMLQNGEENCGNDMWTSLLVPKHFDFKKGKFDPLVCVKKVNIELRHLCQKYGVSWDKRPTSHDLIFNEVFFSIYIYNC
jgi:hypothetical protein